jgi:hypothetical protein
VKFDDYLKEQRKDWRYRFWEAVYWPWFAVTGLVLRFRIWRHRNDPPTECDGHCFICEKTTCLEGREVRAKYGVEAP